MKNKTIDYKACWDTQIIALEYQKIWFNYNNSKLRYLNSLADSYLSSCVKDMLREKDNGIRNIKKDRRK